MRLTIHPRHAARPTLRPRRRPPSARRRHAGAAMLEFSMASLALLVVGLLGPELARWQLTRHIAYLALIESARAGAVDHLRPATMQTAFLDALLPLHASPRGRVQARQRQQQALARVERQTRLPAWRIEVLQPTAAAFADFGLKPATPPIAGRRSINNDYQAEQHQHRLEQGWRNGAGPASGLTIFQANTVRLRLTYLLAPLTPLTRALLRRAGDQQGGHAAQAMASAGMLPIVLELEMDMQSHPVDWGAGPAAGVRRIVFGDCRSSPCPF